MSEGQPAPPPAAQRPVWTWFLTPIAVVIGACIIAAAVWVSNSDGDGDASAGNDSPGVTEPGGVTEPAPTRTLLAAFTDYGKQVGLDDAQFQQCLGDPGGIEVINAHLREGQSFGVTGTPTFFINNKMIVGAQPQAVFDEIIEKELAGSPDTVDGYSALVQGLASSGRFAIVEREPNLEGAPIEGNPEAKVMVAEFSDFQCPFCKRWTDENLGGIRDQLGDDVAMAFLHYPLTQIHPNAGNASLAAVCAGEQGKFWEMHDLLFARQGEWQNLPPN